MFHKENRLKLDIMYKKKQNKINNKLILVMDLVHYVPKD